MEPSGAAQARRTLPVLGIAIDVCTPSQAIDRVAAWARARESRVVCFCNVHSVVTAGNDPAFTAVLAGADMAAPDGAPVAWMLRRQGVTDQQRVSGPDFMDNYIDHAAAVGEPVFLFGSTERTLKLLKDALVRRQPRLLVAGSLAPPFRALTDEEDDAIITQINASGARTVWVGLGCPKQELWMARHRGRIEAVMLGVGAAFDFHAGTVPRAPSWMRRRGLEWLHRLLLEPRRLVGRYLFTNTVFLCAALRQLMAARKSRV